MASDHKTPNEIRSVALAYGTGDSHDALASLAGEVREASARFHDADVEAVIRRGVERILRGQWNDMPRKDVQQLLRRNDTELLLGIAEYLVESAPFESSVKARLRLQGALRFRQLLEESGGTYSISEVEQLLGITDDAIRKRVAARKLLAVPVGDHQEYPVWQFGEYGVLPGFERVLRLLPADHFAAQCRFFLAPSESLGGRSPIEALHDGGVDLDAVERSARQFGVQGTR